jgi:hypothetical protein
MKKEAHEASLTHSQWAGAGESSKEKIQTLDIAMGEPEIVAEA